ncbi:hypothetical protein GTP41_09080 [Pseudoduganella sp. DS3]|uniref:Uncharacterized protein n=1 Tax=Pseudoduganella guangdongensis TaxID=2692179 RepID=A0A6N9HHE5_9BURK|nr:hypothetical protein [Pseudoduganella guangdongensis]MYN02255.1 hypothetical protein [Pseudoduganella guangdongensis]
MDHGERLAKLEAEVDYIRETLVEIKGEQVRLRDHIDRGFAELRTEMAKNTRWMIGIAVTYGTAILGMMAKMAGMY